MKRGCHIHPAPPTSLLSLLSPSSVPSLKSPRIQVLTSSSGSRTSVSRCLDAFLVCCMQHVPDANGGFLSGVCTLERSGWTGQESGIGGMRPNSCWVFQVVFMTEFSQEQYPCTKEAMICEGSTIQSHPYKENRVCPSRLRNSFPGITVLRST